MLRRLLGVFLALCAWSGLGAPIGLDEMAHAQVFTGKKKPNPPKPNSNTSGRKKPAGRTNTRAQPAPPPPPPAPPTYDDPVAFCEAYPDAATPGSDYRGPLVPQWISSAWGSAGPAGGENGSGYAYNWRCAGSRVLVCATPVGSDNCGEPSRETQPTEQMTAYCADKRKGAIPLDVTGPTIPIWVCSKKRAVVSGYRTTVGDAGYLAEFWRDVTDLSPANMAGAVPKSYVASWYVPIKVGLLSSMVKSGMLSYQGSQDELVTTFARMTIDGGDANQVVGQVTYFGQNSRGQVGATGCVADLLLQVSGRDSITVVERYRPTRSSCRKPEQLVLQSRDGQLLVNWIAPGKKKPKRSEWVQRFPN